MTAELKKCFARAWQIQKACIYHIIILILPFFTKKIIILRITSLNFIRLLRVVISGAPARFARSGAPWVRKFGKLSIPENLVMT